MSGPGSENDFSKSAGEMKIPNQYDNVDYGKKTKLVVRKVVSCDADGKVYGSKAIVTKENKQTFIQHLISEGEDVTLLPQRVIGELKKLIRDGAKDLTQDWKHALHLVNTAYHVANVRRPTPDEKGGWNQYEDLIKFSVKQLSATRGLDGKWRTSTVMVREDMDQQGATPPLDPQAKAKLPTLRSFVQRPPTDDDIGKRRFFVEIPGQAAVEIEGKTMDEIIEAIGNKMRRHGAKIRVEERAKTHSVITVWVQDVKRDRIVIKEIS
jgi:hypothetical protein